MIGRTLAHFEITAKLGEGGMGEVYRALDTKLGRDVAIKVLPESLSADPERLARFEREAKVLASLNQPNIAGLHQIEEVDGRQLLVMELAEGEDLAERLERGALPVEEAVGIARQVAEGLAAAHSAGIVHRDLKPANIKVAADGQVKILDFGLAKAQEAVTEASPDVTRSPTLTARMTGAGVILGTAAYMSPEQARGQATDLRADIWALGVVLWEMLTGRRLFSEPTVSDTLAAVLRADIDLEALPEETPRRLRRIVERCLSRDPRRRYHSAADLGIDLSEILSEDPVSAPSGEGPSRSGRLPWMIAAATSLLLVLTVTAEFWTGESEPDAPPSARIVTTIVPTGGVRVGRDIDALALSPDGSRLAFVGIDAEGRKAIWLRPLARDEARPLPQTAGGRSPFWSADGRRLGFEREGELRILEIESGLVEVLVPVATGERGVSWSPGGTILFAGDDRTIMAVEQTGGEPRPVTERAEGANDYFRPSFLPDGHHFLFHERRYSSEEQIGRIRIGSLDGEPSRPLFESFSAAEYVEPGYVLWWHQGNLRAQRFDSRRLEPTGAPFSVVSDVLWDPRAAAAGYTASKTGILVYRAGGRVAGNRLTWIGRDGEILGSVGPAGSIYSPSLSPDGRRVAVDVSGDSNQGDIWVLEGDGSTSTPVVTWPEDDSYPVWSPDGSELAFFSSRGGGLARIFRIDLTAGGGPALTFAGDGDHVTPSAWLADGRTLLFLRGHYSSQSIGALDLESGESRPIIADGFDARNPSVSPDGRWIAFDSDMSGRREVYVAPFPEASGRTRISTAGGFGPVWSRDGAEIFFVSPFHDAIFSVGTALEDGEMRFGQPTKLFSADMKEHRKRQYDTIDGQRFLVNVNVDQAYASPVILVQNWASGLHEPRVGPGRDD